MDKKRGESVEGQTRVGAKKRKEVETWKEKRDITTVCYQTKQPQGGNHTALQLFNPEHTHTHTTLTYQ